MVNLTGHWLVWLALFGVVWSNNQFDLDRLVSTIHSYGYVIDIHNVTTTDGYILNIFRIPHGKNNSNIQNKPVVFLNHGVYSDGSDFFAAREKGAAYMLADAGFDVWIINSRGTIFSREHKTLKADFDSQYWNFSWHEIGIYDLPCTIDYVLSTTKQKKLFYVGHSEGTTTYYVLLSEKPEYNKKIILQISLAPIAYLTHIGGVFGLLKPILLPTVKLVEFLGIHEFKRSSLSFSIPTCAVAPVLCSTILMMFAGFDYKELNTTLIRTYPAYFPGGCSTKQLHHYIQSVVQGHFRQFDYGVEGNLKRYGSTTPPDYNLMNIKAPITFVYGEADFYSTIPDVKRLLLDVTNSVAKTVHQAPYKSWNHMDYIISNDVDKLNDYIISQLKGYL